MDLCPIPLLFRSFNLHGSACVQAIVHIGRTEKSDCIVPGDEHVVSRFIVYGRFLEKSPIAEVYAASFEQ
jgi:hypothetical protein